MISVRLLDTGHRRAAARRRLHRLISLTILTATVPSAAQKPASDVEPRAGDLVRAVSARLLAKLSPPVEFAWPPRVSVSDGPEIDAYADLQRDPSGFVVRRKGKPVPVVVLSRQLLAQVVGLDEDCLAAFMAHELGHVALKHILRSADRTVSGFDQRRREEIDADLFGLRLALRSGFSYSGAIHGYQRLARAVQDSRSPDHPDTSLRISRMLAECAPIATDRLAGIRGSEAKLWQSMSAFSSGRLLLADEHYEAAAVCFQAVVDEFPDCFEARTNVGYAQLMQYCDALTPDDLRDRFGGVGFLAVGAFYERPESLRAKARGVRTDLWKAAVANLSEAREAVVKAGGSTALPDADLGIARLLQPDGPDSRAAATLLSNAARQVEGNEDLSAPVRAAILCNAATASRVGGDLAACERFLQSAEKLMGPDSPGVLYNRACLKAELDSPEGRKQAVELLARFLSAVGPGSIWSPLAYDRYTALAGSLRIPIRGLQDLAPPPGRVRFRPFDGVTLKGAPVSLLQPTNAVERRLGAAVRHRVTPTGPLNRLEFPDLGVSLLGSERVVCIVLSGPKAPDLALRERSPASIVRGRLKTGMKRAAVDRLLLGLESDIDSPLGGSGVSVYYPSLGLVVRYQKAGTSEVVEELAIVEYPRRG